MTTAIGLNHPGTSKLTGDGGNSFYDVNTKPRSYAKNASSYDFKIYNTNPSYLDERSGHYSVVVQKPIDLLRGQPDPNQIFGTIDPERNRLTEYFTRQLPSERKSTDSALVLKQYGLAELLDRFLRSKVQEDVDEVLLRTAGSTGIARQDALDRLQNRYNDMIRHYSTDTRLRDALIKEYIGSSTIPPALQAELERKLRHEQASFGATAIPVSPGDTQTPLGATDSFHRGAYVDDMEQKEGESELDATPAEFGELPATTAEVMAGGADPVDVIISGEQSEQYGDDDLVEPQSGLRNLRPSGRGEGLGASPMITTHNIGTSARPGHLSRGIAGGLGERRGLSNPVIGQQPPSAQNTAVASFGEEGAGAYRSEILERRPPRGRTLEVDLESQIFGSTTADPGSVSSPVSSSVARGRRAQAGVPPGGVSVPRNMNIDDFFRSLPRVSGGAYKPNK